MPLDSEVSMTTKSSIHFAKCRPAGQPERHNFRQYSSDDFRPSYFLPPEDQLPNTYKDLLEPNNSKADADEAEKNARGFFDDMKSHYSGRGKRAKYENCRREAILNLSESSTEADVMNVVKYLKDRWHITTTSYAIHRDEGYKDQDGIVHRNLHCHLVLDSLYLENGKPKQAWSAITINDLRTIQDEIAKIMRMERTRGTGRARAHLDRETWKTVKIQQDAAEHQRRQAEAASARARTATAQATAAAQAAALEAERAAQEKKKADQAKAEAARQRAQVQRDIANHKLQPSGLFVNKALKQANADQAEIITQLQRKADATEANHRQEIIEKDRQLRVMHEASEDRRQTIRQLRTQLDEAQQTITEQAKTINEQAETISAYEGLANMMRDVIEVIAAAVPEKIIDTAIGAMTKAVEKAGRLGHKILDLWEKTANHKEREAAERLEREQAARAEREAAERRQAEEAARKSRGRGYSR